MSFSPILGTVFSTYSDWENEALNEDQMLNATLNLFGEVSVSIPDGRAISLEKLVSHVNFLYQNLADLYDIEKEANLSEVDLIPDLEGDLSDEKIAKFKANLEQRRRAILGLRKIEILQRKTTENHGLIQKIYYIFIGLFRSLLLDRKLNRSLKENRDLQEKFSWFKSDVWEDISVGHKAKKIVTNQEGKSFYQAPKEAVVPILKNILQPVEEFENEEIAEELGKLRTENLRLQGMVSEFVRYRQEADQQITQLSQLNAEQQQENENLEENIRKIGIRCDGLEAEKIQLNDKLTRYKGETDRSVDQMHQRVARELTIHKRRQASDQMMLKQAQKIIERQEKQFRLLINYVSQSLEPGASIELGEGEDHFRICASGANPQA